MSPAATKLTLGTEQECRGEAARFEIWLGPNSEQTCSSKPKETSIIIQFTVRINVNRSTKGKGVTNKKRLQQTAELGTGMLTADGEQKDQSTQGTRRPWKKGKKQRERG